MTRPEHAPDDRDIALAVRLADWSDPEPTPCKWCDSEGVVWLLDGGTEPCPECNGLGVIEHGF
jgi:hypothetical protein